MALTISLARTLYSLARPTRRPLKIFASDPMAGHTAGNRITIDVPREDLSIGPVGERLEVIDYGGAQRCFYPLVDLNDPTILMQGGLDPAESDPRFHQQMVSAVTMRTLENFDRTLGRVVTFSTRRYRRLRLFPHAFHGANAFYDRNLNGILFGYFRADRDNPGENLPGGTGLLPAGDLHPDLINRIAGEASRTAQNILRMSIRACDYLPPIDITFGDYLRALITADYELLPADESGQRSAMIEAFRLRGIYPEQVVSLAEESLLWPSADRSLPPLPVQQEPLMLQYLVTAATNFGRIGSVVPISSSDEYFETDEGEEVDLSQTMAERLHAYAEMNRQRLLLHPHFRIQVQGFHPVFRVAPNGQLLIELMVQFVPSDRTPHESAEFGGLPLRGRCTVIASVDGRVRYVIAKPLVNETLDPSHLELPKARLDRQGRFLPCTT